MKSLFRRLYPVRSRTVPCTVRHCTLLGLIWQATALAQTAEIEFFENRIRPVLAQECYECHSSTGKQKGGLVLDYRDGLLIGGDSGPAIEPGKAGESLLIEALKHENDLEMPKAGVKLDPPVIEDLERWVNMGAPDPRDKPPTKEELERDTNWSAIFQTRQNWWSFQPVKEPQVPDGPGSEIDRFIHGKLDKGGLQPSPAAEDRTLARRLYYALTGLPPAPGELDNFITKAAIDREKATSQLIDKLLASPRFGERWARHWMDWVRYAESHGSEGDPKINNAHYYRDYLIRALNANIPYDQMLREHIAGDLLENPRFNEEDGFNESILGAIHWRMVFHGFAPTDALDEKIRFTDDQINTFTKAFQGLTVSCARCHDHKFDAISQADYYALFGVLGSTRPGRKLIDAPVALEKNKKQLAALKPKIRESLAEEWIASLDQVRKKLLTESLWETGKAQGSIFHPFYLAQKGKNTTVPAALRKIGNIYTSSKKEVEAGTEFDLSDRNDSSKWYRYGNGVTEKPAESGEFMLFPEGENVIDRILPCGMYSGLLSTKHAGRLTSPDISLSGKSTLQLLVNGDGKACNRYVVHNSPRRGTLFKIERLGVPKKNQPARPDWHWMSYNLDYWKGDEIHIELATAKDTAVLVENIDRSWFGIREARIVTTGTTAPTNPALEFLGALPLDAAPATVAELADLYINALRKSLELWKNHESTDADALLLDKFASGNLLPNRLSELPKSATLIKKYRDLEAEIKAPTRVPGTDEWTASDQPLFERGDHKKPLETVSRRFIETVDDSPYQTSKSGRLEMAEDLLREDNPFTRRVIVNRIWTHLFGNGIVGSVDNFGRLGEKPSHPELLDYLAVKFDEEYDWSVKALIKEIVTSQTWQQSSFASEAAKETDPENRLLSYFHVRRLEAEAIRDKLLAVSGLLDTSMYGTSVSGTSNRRSVYVQVIRNRLDPFLGVFDAPIPFSTTGKRPVTNVPAQSLTMLNDPMMKKFSTAFLQSFSGSREQKIRDMWTTALGRPPSAEEVTAATGFLDQLNEQHTDLLRKADSLRSQIDTLSASRDTIIRPVREKLEAALGADSTKPVDPASIGVVASWDFESGITDPVNGIGGRLSGNAKVENGDLILDGKSSFLSDPLPVTMKEKTLEVLVTLNTLNQRAGGAITIQDLRGGQFDSIVFAERRTNEWMAGSNGFTRTKDFGGPADSEAATQAVHFVIAYDSDGTIRGYRNGRPYGKPYNSGAVATYPKGDSQILFGLRHGTSDNGNRNLNAVIHLGRIYNTALDESTIASLAAGKRILTQKDILAALPADQLASLNEIQAKIRDLNEQLSRIRIEDGNDAVWRSFAHSLFNLKEFIYVY
ncbi:MAG: PSD1 and planctomycete cytochrome C domain-containing protein [Verrucomicrobiales bacterium]|nr:PSD1 and planctomycete cytochrome C domain-containing protein [Verrucomicrobiales bacterium]